MTGSQIQHPGSMGCLAQGHLSRDKEVNCHPSSYQPTNLFFERWVGIEPHWLLDDHTNHWPTATLNTNIQMFEKNTHTNAWQKHAYKCMTKTRIKNRIQMYDKKTYTNMQTNVWKKHAYKCMKKTRIKNRIQMYDKKTHTNVWKKYSHTGMVDSQLQLPGSMGVQCLAQ